MKRVNGMVMEKCDMTFEEERSGLERVRDLFFSKLVMGERERCVAVLKGMFGRLSWEDLEEVYSDGCLVLWNKMSEVDFRFGEKSVVAYLLNICKNV